ncbi:MAG: GGDEF domain-containing protein [Oscillospiraceae bacterium]|nr:GGDEF domain-containing protein [Oscillospiraceae bacterium]
MEHDKTTRYYQYLEKLTDEMNDPDHFDRAQFVALLTEISEFFGLSKGVTEFYENVMMEQRGIGEVLIDYDNGHGDVCIVDRRFITKTQAVIRGRLYIAAETPMLPDEDIRRGDLIMRCVLGLVSRNRLIDTVETLMFHDQSGFPNLRAFARFMSHECMNGGISGRTAVHFNLRHFGMINHDIGRAQGDIVMHNYFDLLDETIGETGIICRVGGDNFVMVCENQYVEQVLEILSGYPVPFGNEQRVDVSGYVGVYVLPDGFIWTQIGDIMDKVTAASQAAKRGNHGNIVYFDQKMHDMKENQVRIQALFPLALEKHEFHAFYQPKVDVYTGRIVGAEALCRWFHDGQIVPPGQFIPVLEQNTDICQLDFYMLETACEHLRKWLNEGRNVVRISVNLSRKHLMNVDLLDRLLSIIDRHLIPHEYIEIELTETTTEVEFNSLKRVVSGLQRVGIFTSVDDFGMGYSSLNLIRELPWNVLKIDRCFVPPDDETDTSTTSLMYKHVIAMTQDMGLECITEGVETRRQVDVLRKNHCGIAQGFFFDKPLPVEEFEKRLDQQFYPI